MNQDAHLSSRQATQDAAKPQQAAPNAPRSSTWAVVLIAVALTLVGAGIYLRRAQSALPPAAASHAVPPPRVTVSTARLGSATDSFVLPGNVVAFNETPIYAHTNGYLLHWYFDIGAHVKKGALLALISAPEVDKQLGQAEADLATAEANARNAESLAQRYSGLVSSNAVSQQQTDTYVNEAAATAAAVRAAQANVESLKALQGYEKVYAPFAGVITARTIDTGQLVNNGTGQELFHIQQVNPLRVYTNVPQIYAAAIRPGMKVSLTFPEYPGKTFPGTVARTAAAIDPVARTLLVEVRVENRSGKLLPGELAQVHFKTPAVVRTFIEPSATEIFRHKGLEIGTVVDGDRARLVPIVIGQDDGANVQIASGLHPGDQVILDPPDSLVDGELLTVVHAKPAPPPPAR